MQDVVNALNSTPVDNPVNFGLQPAPNTPANSPPAGTIYYLSPNSSTGKLQLTVGVPPGDSIAAADGTAIQYWATYEITGGAAPTNDPTKEACRVCSENAGYTAYGGAPNGPAKTGFNGWNSALGPVPDANGDNGTHEDPFRHIGQLNSSSNYIYAEDMMQWTPDSTANPNSCNFGDLQFYRSVGQAWKWLQSIN